MGTERDDRIPATPEEQAPAAAEQAPAEENPQQGPDKPPYKPYSRKARLWAWAGIVFMIFLVLMYTYAFSSGIILKY